MACEILTTVVGSYPAPTWLLAGHTEEALRDATAVVFHTQELAGIDVPADGELYRFDPDHSETNGMVEYFIRPLRNVRTEISRSEERRFRDMPGMQFRIKPAGVVEGQLGEGSLNITRDYQRSRALARGKLKFTVTSPYMLARTLVDRHYKDPQALAVALADVMAHQIAEIDADMVQVDEANISGRPEDAAWAIEPLNHIFDSIMHESAIHLCFGNYAGQPIQKGQWKNLVDFLNRLHVDHVIGEMAYRGYGELEQLKGVRPEIGIGLGVINVKSTVVESPEEIARAIEAAEKTLGPGRIRYVHPDCGFWMLRRPIVDAKLAALVKGRNLYLGQKTQSSRESS